MVKPRRANAGADFVRLLWQQPLLTVPFAIFFGVIFGHFPQSLPGAYRISFVFSMVVGVSMWAVHWFVLKNHEGLKHWWKAAIYYSVASVGASLLAAIIVDQAVQPGFLGSGRSIAMILMFALLFCALFMGIGMAMAFYQDAVERAKAGPGAEPGAPHPALVPARELPQRPRIEIHATNVSSRQVSGDFYDVVPIADEGLLLAVADVSGKGVPAWRR